MKLDTIEAKANSVERAPKTRILALVQRLPEDPGCRGMGEGPLPSIYGT